MSLSVAASWRGRLFYTGGGGEEEGQARQKKSQCQCTQLEHRHVGCQGNMSAPQLCGKRAAPRIGTGTARLRCQCRPVPCKPGGAAAPRGRGSSTKEEGRWVRHDRVIGPASPTPDIPARRQARARADIRPSALPLAVSEATSLACLRLP